MKVKIYESLGKNGIRIYTFLVGYWYESFAIVYGRKRVNLRKLLLKTKLRKRSLDEENAMPDKEYVIDMKIPLDKFRDVR